MLPLCMILSIWKEQNATYNIFYKYGITYSYWIKTFNCKPILHLAYNATTEALTYMKLITITLPYNLNAIEHKDCAIFLF